MDVERLVRAVTLIADKMEKKGYDGLAGEQKLACVEAVLDSRVSARTRLGRFRN